MNIAQAYRYLEFDDKGNIVRALSKLHKAGELNPKEPIVDILEE